MSSWTVTGDYIKDLVWGRFLSTLLKENVEFLQELIAKEHTVNLTISGDAAGQGAHSALAGHALDYDGGTKTLNVDETELTYGGVGNIEPTTFGSASAGAVGYPADAGHIHEIADGAMAGYEIGSSTFTVTASGATNFSIPFPGGLADTLISTGYPLVLGLITSPANVGDYAVIDKYGVIKTAAGPSVYEVKIFVDHIHSGSNYTVKVFVRVLAPKTAFL